MESLRIVMAFVALFDLELHQMNIKIMFLNIGLSEEVYMEEFEGFISDRDNHLSIKLKNKPYTNGL